MARLHDNIYNNMVIQKEMLTAGLAENDFIKGPSL